MENDPIQAVKDSLSSARQQAECAYKAAEASGGVPESLQKAFDEFLVSLEKGQEVLENLGRGRINRQRLASVLRARQLSAKIQKEVGILLAKRSK